MPPPRIARALLDPRTLSILGLLLVLTFLVAWTLFRFTRVLDVPSPSRGEVQAVLVVLAVAVAAMVATVFWMARERWVHDRSVYIAMGAGALIGLFYALAFLPDDFSETRSFGPLFIYGVLQSFVLLPVSLAVWLVAFLRLKRLPTGSEEVTGAFVVMPFAFQAGMHAGIVGGAWATLGRLIQLARDYHAPKELPGVGMLIVVGAVLGLMWLRRRMDHRA